MKIIQGVPYPYYTTEDRDNLFDIEVNFKINNSTTSKVKEWDGATWVEQGSGGSSLSTLEWKYNSAAFVSDLTAGQFQFNADKTILYLSYVLNPNVGLGNTIQSYVEGIKSGSKFIFRDSTGKILELVTTSDSAQVGASIFAQMGCTVLNDSGIGNGLNCVVEIAGVSGGSTTADITNAAALANVESTAGATQAVINGNINARLFEQIGFNVVGQGVDAIVGKTAALTSIPYAFKAYELGIDYEVVPTGSGAIITFYKNGTSIGTVTVLAGEDSGLTTLGSVVSFAKGDTLRATVTQEGLTIIGQSVNAYIQGIKYQ